MCIPALKTSPQLPLTQRRHPASAGRRPGCENKIPCSLRQLSGETKCFSNGPSKTERPKVRGTSTPPLLRFTMSGNPHLYCVPNEACEFCSAGLQWGLSEVMNQKYLRMTKRTHPGHRHPVSPMKSMIQGFSSVCAGHGRGSLGGSARVSGQTHACSRRDRCITGREGSGGGLPSALPEPG